MVKDGDSRFYKGKACHKKCLQALQKKKPQERKECEIQAVLALHLFSLLVANPQLLADLTCDEKCCSCGNSKVWHGRADILIRHSKVKVVKDVREEIDEEGCGEPQHKKIRKYSEGSTCTSDYYESDTSFVKTAYRDHYMPLGPFKLQTGVHCKDLSQVLAQTIVNAFIQNKKFPALKEYFIPCFLASENNITIHMYNPFYDILLTHGESMQIFSQGKLNIDTIFAVWMALNFYKFPVGLSDENIQETWQKYFTESSGFHNAISSCMDVYRNEMDEPMIHDDPVDQNMNHNNLAFIFLLKEMWENE
ncbi:uncharacterized protein LOC132746742, partial [Ruditapes philippinarum]|uniref:uncharacterized protein LOC132746742 n=1 Tax=Ruditapes philippinarum TaxID=129788 RepID=UPI00295B807E